jgi:HD-GYP domain-containing protein (c-di-GMP phosphodiesterase class II)
MLKTLTIDELEVGMFVKDIVLKSSKHKVKNQGVVNSARTIEMLKKQGVCSVVIECEPSEDLPPVQTDNQPNDPANNRSKQDKSNDIPLADEFERCCDVYDQSSETIKKLFNIKNLSQTSLSAPAINELASEITDSVMRNEYAMTILTRIRDRSAYQWEHAINCAVLICGFGLYLGLKKETVQQMTLGAIVHDAGVAKVSRAILEKSAPLTENEMSVVKKHVVWGIELCKRDGFDQPMIIDMVANHHERIDGSGYPKGLTGDKISKLAKITAIVDVYDAMTGDRPYKDGEHPLKVFRFLMSQQQKFDQELVQQFIKYLGVYPVGSLVKLSNDKLAIVIEGNRINPLKPKVKIIYSLKLQHTIKAADCDLENVEVTIESAVNAEDHGINLSRIIRDII